MPSFEDQIKKAVSARLNEEFRRMVDGRPVKQSDAALRNKITEWILQCPSDATPATRLAIAEWVLKGHAEPHLNSRIIKLESDLARINEQMVAVRRDAVSSMVHDPKPSTDPQMKQLKAARRRVREELKKATEEADQARNRLIEYSEKAMVSTLRRKLGDR